MSNKNRYDHYVGMVERCEKIINSCITEKQLESADKYLELFKRQIKNAETNSMEGKLFYDKVSSQQKDLRIKIKTFIIT